MVILDSEFSQYVDDRFLLDKTITPVGQIKKDLDKTESIAISAFNKTFDRAVSKAVDFLSNTIALGKEKEIKQYKWGLHIGLSNDLYGEWLLGWQSGKKTGDREADALRHREINKTINFAQPEPESAILRNRAAEQAIKNRVNTLARDVSDSEWEAIKGDILDAIKPPSADRPPISRKELLKRIDEKLGDRKNKFKGRAETIARTELTFAYNAGRLDSYVRSPLVEGVRFSTIFDERRCAICASRQGIIVSLEDIEGLAQLAIPVHPRCRCVWSPVLKTEFKGAIATPGRKIKDRKLIKGKTWLSGAILAAVLIPEELFILGLLGTAARGLVAKYGTIKLAREAIAAKINGANVKIAYPSVPNIDLNSADPKQLRSLVPDLNDLQLQQILQARDAKAIDLEDLKGILNVSQYLKVKAIARENYILKLLSLDNNLSPSALWINSGSIIPRDKASKIYKLIKNNQFSAKKDLMLALRAEGIDIEAIDRYAQDLFDRQNSNRL